MGMALMLLAYNGPSMKVYYNVSSACMVMCLLPGNRSTYFLFQYLHQDTHVILFAPMYSFTLGLLRLVFINNLFNTGFEGGVC